MLRRAASRVRLGSSANRVWLGSAFRSCSTVPVPAPAADPASSAAENVASTAAASEAAVPLAEAVHQLKTVPIPIVVGPVRPEPLSGHSVVDSAAAAAGSQDAVIQAVSMAENSGGWFFSRPMWLVESGMVYVHNVSGLPWWATFAVLTGGARLLVFPLVVAQNKTMAKMSKIKPQMDVYTRQMKEANSRGLVGQQEAKEAEKNLQNLMSAHGISLWHPLVTFGGAIGQFPIWMTFFFTIQDIAGRDDGLLGLQTGGMLWFSDLTVRDPYLLLPALCGVSLSSMIALGDAGSAGAQMDDKKKLMVGASLIMMPALTYWMQSGVFVYWIANNFFALGQTLLLKTPVARKIFGMPPLPKGTSMLPQMLSAAKPSAPAGPYIPETFSQNPTKQAVATKKPAVQLKLRSRKPKGKRR